MRPVVVLAAVLAAASPAAGQRLSLLDVPFITQSESLCGGAAVAMVLRFWGERGVNAEEFSPLVDRAAGGIRTTTLVAAVRSRGWQAVEISSGGVRVQSEVAGGRPVIALIEDRPGTYHYVVVVGWHERAVVIHDPARTPFRVVPRPDFERRWKAARSWALVIGPARADLKVGPYTANGDNVGADLSLGFARDRQVGPVSSCADAVARGVTYAQQNDLGQAERVLADASYACADAAPLRELAGVRLLQRRWPEVRELASEALRLEPGDAHATRLLATSLFLEHDPDGALRAWNAVREPILDLTRVDGLSRTRQRVIERYIGVEPGALLTPDVFERTNRRLDDFPSAFVANAGYIPVPGGRAELHVNLAERSLMPHDAFALAAIGVRAAAAREVGWSAVSPTGGGERFDVSWRFWPGRPRYALGLVVPTPIGVVGVDGAVEHQPFTSGIAESRRATARVSLTQWATGRVRWEARAGLDRWNSLGHVGTIGGGVRIESARVRLEAAVDGWAGASRFLSSRATAGWRSSARPEGMVFLARAGVHAIGGAAPLDLWPAADTGHARDVLLRAHPVLDGGALRVDRLARRVWSASAGVERWIRRGSPLRLGGASFVDAARTGARGDVDAGVGLRLQIPGLSGILRLDVAHGLRDGRDAVSLLWTADLKVP